MNPVCCDGGEAGAADRSEALVVQTEDRIVSLNDAAVVLLGADDTDTLLGRTLGEFVAPGDRQALERKIDRILNGETQALGLTVTLEPLDGAAERDIITVSSPVNWDSTQAVQTTLLDVRGNRYDAVTTLRNKAMHQAPVGISIADARQDDMPLIYVNDGFVELTGYPREEVIGQNCRFLQGEATRDEPVTQMREAISREETVVVELRNYQKDGTMFWNRITLSPVENRDGEVTHYLGFQEDISETKAFEHESTLFEAQIDATEQAIYITDSAGTIEYVNTAFEGMTGYTATEAVGRNARTLQSNEQDGPSYQAFWEQASDGDVLQDTFWSQKQSGEYYQTNETIVPVSNDRGEITNYVAIRTEVTGEEIRNQMLQVLDRVLRHNIRNTVTTISGFASALEADLSDPEAASMLERIQASADDLEAISERMKPVFEVFRGASDPTPWPVEGLVDTIEASRTAYTSAEITVDCQAPLAARVVSGRVASITVTEAIENAVVHNDQASPSVEITIRTLAGPPRLYIEIADDGPGMPVEEWEIVQSGVERPLSHTSGIGLWLIKWMIRATGGKATMSDNEPQGTVVGLEMPLEGATVEETGQFNR